LFTLARATYRCEYTGPPPPKRFVRGRCASAEYHSTPQKTNPSAASLRVRSGFGHPVSISCGEIGSGQARRTPGGTGEDPHRRAAAWGSVCVGAGLDEDEAPEAVSHDLQPDSLLQVLLVDEAA
jgi:hypothetical protein